MLGIDPDMGMHTYIEMHMDMDTDWGRHEYDCEHSKVIDRKVGDQHSFPLFCILSPVLKYV